MKTLGMLLFLVAIIGIVSAINPATVAACVVSVILSVGGFVGGYICMISNKDNK